MEFFTNKVVHQMLSERRNCISYMQLELWHLLTYDFLENVVVIDMSVYMSVAERIKCIFISLLLQGAILCLCSFKKSGNLIMTGEWPPCLLSIGGGNVYFQISSVQTYYAAICLI